SGIHELLEEKGKEYIFLGVKSFDKEDNAEWWLNGYGSVCGWYNTEDLKLWAEDKGPVIEDAKRDE
ncbi:hypothetical protein GOV10_02130, partial [Candidatus Woesearchaeota archaeon]|nr:hypothetical protein [Candidatus Woesearchaeota archaeon]